MKIPVYVDSGASLQQLKPKVQHNTLTDNWICNKTKRLATQTMTVAESPFTRSSKHQANVFKIHVHDVCSNCLMFAWCLLHRVNGVLDYDGNEIWNKIGYNSAYVKDIGKIFASMGGFSGIGHRMMPREFFPERPSLPWQQNLGHNGLELGLRKRYIEELCIRWGVFKIGLFWYGQCAIIQ